MQAKKKAESANNRPAQNKINLDSYPKSIIPDKDKFLNKLFKDLSGFIEIREITDSYHKQKFFKSVDDLLEYDPPKDKNIYIGMLTRDKKRGRNQDTLQTQAIWLDFDDKDSFYGFEHLVNLNKLPEPTLIINSGHGYHIYYRLDKPAGREVEPVVKKLARKVGADTRATDLARIMRVPGTMNVKNPDQPVKCEIVKVNDNEINLNNLAEILGTTAEVITEPQSKAEQAAKSLQVDYEGIISQAKWPCIKSILEGVEEGQRNWALGRLTMYFRNILGFSRRKAEKVVRVWNLKNKPAQPEVELLKSFKSYWVSNYNLLGCKIESNPDLQQILNKHCDRKGCIRATGSVKSRIEVKEGKTASFYNNRIIKRIDKLHGTALIIYAVLEKHEEGLTADRATEIINLNKKHFRNRAKELEKLGFIEIKKGNRRRGIKDLYKINRQGTYGTGRTSISYGAVIAAANSVISPAQYKVYLLLKWYEQIGQNNGVYPSTFTLADKLRLDQSTVQNHITELYKKDFIEVDKSEEGYNIYKLQI
jgi:predicted transcriptional regulator